MTPLKFYTCNTLPSPRQPRQGGRGTLADTTIRLANTHRGDEVRRETARSIDRTRAGESPCRPRGDWGALASSQSSSRSWCSLPKSSRRRRGRCLAERSSTTLANRRADVWRRPRTSGPGGGRQKVPLSLSPWGPGPMTAGEARRHHRPPPEQAGRASAGAPRLSFMPSTNASSGRASFRPGNRASTPGGRVRCSTLR